jgi:hypothetical protein
MENKKKFADNKLRSAKIKDKMVEGYGKPIIVFAYFNTMAEAKQALNATNAMIYKGAKRGGTARGFRIIAGHDVSKGLTHFNNMLEISKSNKSWI